MRLRSFASVTSLLLAACASAPPRDKMAWETEAERAPAPAATAADPAARPAVAADPRQDGPRDPRPGSKLPTGKACEAAARALLPSSPDGAWTALKACVERQRFLALPQLLDGTWDRELRTRTDASPLLAHLIANRGGDLIGDLRALRKARLPIFGLETAMKQPEIYKGRLILVRARVDEVKPMAGGKASVKLAQVALASTYKYVDEGGYRFRSSESGSGAASAGGSYSDSSGYSGSASASGAGSYSGRSEYTASVERRVADNDVVETGLVALARMKLDPFLEHGRDYLMLGRFDGVREEAGEDEQVTTLAVISLHGYYDVNPNLALE